MPKKKTKIKTAPVKKATKRKRPPARKTAAPTPEQVDQVKRWFAEGNSQADVEASAKHHWPSCKPRDLVQLAVTQFVEEGAADEHFEAFRGFCMAALREVYRRAIAIGEYSAAIRSIKELLAIAKEIDNERLPPEDQPNERA